MGTGAVTGAGSSPQSGLTLPGSSGAAGAGGQLGQTAFLQLLVAEMQNQNPLNPMDSTGFVTQLAQFQMLSDLNGIEADLNSMAGKGTAGASATGGQGQGGTAAAGTTQAGGAVP